VRHSQFACVFKSDHQRLGQWRVSPNSGEYTPTQRLFPPEPSSPGKPSPPRASSYINRVCHLTLVYRTQSVFCSTPLSYTQTSLPLPIQILTNRLSTRIVSGDSVDHIPFSVASSSHPFRAQRIQNLAYALIQAGICPGDRVAVLAPNS
jgi:hypothetical protein